MTDLVALASGLIVGLLAGSLLTALAFRVAIDQLAEDAVRKVRRDAGLDVDEGRAWEDPYEDWPRG